MKKLLVAVVLLVAVGGTLFYLGWVQIQLPENTYAVVFTKTNGWDERVTPPGEFSWRWERLIPTNMTLHTFVLEPVTIRTDSEGKLPNADTYAAELDSRPDFSYAVEIAVSFSVSPDALPELAAEDRVTPETLDEWLSTMGSSLADSAAAEALRMARDPSNATQLAAKDREAVQTIRRRLSQEFSALDIHDVVIEKISVPDIALYEFAREQYQEIVRARTEARRLEIIGRAEAESASAQYFSLLERYGEILDRHPALLDLLKLEGITTESLLAQFDQLQAARTRQ